MLACSPAVKAAVCCSLLSPFLVSHGLIAPVQAAELDDLFVITATRVPQKLDETLSSVTVIDRMQIEQSQARTLDELLAGVAGISLTRAGGIGQVTSLFMRGGESDHVLWLVDGVRIGSVTAGLPALQDLPLETIERIEIVRGTRSSLYGPDAMAGVVQIFTRRGSLAPTLRLMGGSNGTLQGSASVGTEFDTSVGASRIDLQATHFQTDGTNACLGLPFPPGGGCFTNDPDRDPYENTSVSLRVSHRLDSGAEFESFVQRSEADVSYDSSFLDQSALVNQMVGLRAAATLGEGWRSIVNLGRAWDESTSFSAAASFTSIFNSRRDSFTWQNDLKIGALEVVAGLDWLRDQVSSDTAYTTDSRVNRAGFLQVTREWGRQSFSVAGRFDDNEQFGGNATGNVAWGWRSEQGVQWHASFGNAFKSPTFNDLYFPGFSNPDLDPERARTLELGVKGRGGLGRWSASLYRSKVDDLVTFDLATFLPQNIAETLLVGAEASLEGQRGAWRWGQTLNWLDAEDRTATNFGKRLPRRPEWSGRSSVGWQSGMLDLGASVLFASRRYDDLANTRSLGGYAVLDVLAGWQVSPSIQWQLRLANVLDRDYESLALYPAPGREVFVSVRYRAPR